MKRSATEIKVVFLIGVSTLHQILVVDDDKRIRQVIKKYFTSLGHSVDEVENGLLAVETIRKDPTKYEVVIMDMMMPEMNGIEAFEEIHTFAPEIPVIMSTAFGNITLGIEFMKKGGADFIEKPLSMEVLAVKVKQVLENKLLQDALLSEKISKQALLEANKLKREFLYKVTHEFRTPIHAILNFSKFGSNQAEQEKILGYFNNINQAGSRLLGLIDSLMSYSKMEADIVSFDIKRADIIACFQLALSEYKELRGDASVDVRLLNLLDTSITHFDFKRLKQAFVRLLELLFQFDVDTKEVYVVAKASTIRVSGQGEDFVSTPAIKISLAKFLNEVPTGKIDQTIESFSSVNQNEKQTEFLTDTDLQHYMNIIKAHRGSLASVSVPNKGVLYEVLLPFTGSLGQSS